MQALWSVLPLLLVSQPALGGLIAHPELARRANAPSCDVILASLKASAFCSSFIRLQDVTKTFTQNGPSQTNTVTLPGAPCTFTKPGSTITNVPTLTLPAPTNTVTIPPQTITQTAVVPGMTVTSLNTLVASTTT